MNLELGNTGDAVVTLYRDWQEQEIKQKHLRELIEILWESRTLRKWIDEGDNFKDLCDYVLERGDKNTECTLLRIFGYNMLDKQFAQHTAKVFSSDLDNNTAKDYIKTKSI